MESGLNIQGLFESEQELRDVVEKRKICYDFEPYYIPGGKKGGLLQIGFQLSLYGTGSNPEKDLPPGSEEYGKVEYDVRRVAEALSNTCGPLHMCETTTVDPSTITYSHERKMRPDVTVHIPVFDQKNFGHPVDDTIRKTLDYAVRLLESVGVRKKRWQE